MMEGRKEVGSEGSKERSCEGSVGGMKYRQVEEGRK